MGFKLPQITYKVDFEGHAVYDGLEVRVKEMPLGQLVDMMGLTGLKDAKNLDGEDLEQLKSVFSLAEELIVGWNVEDDDGNPVPVSRETVRSLGAGIFMDLFTRIFDQVLSVDDSLKAKLAAGGQLEKEQLPPMEQL